MAVPMMQGLVLVLALSTLLDVTYAVEWVVGGDVQKWTFLHANDAPTFYNDWASNITFKTGDTLIFEYDNAIHSVVQLAEADFSACKVKTPLDKWGTGRDSVFISKAGTSGAPQHCEQGMKVAINATGTFVAAPPAPLAIAPAPAGQNTSHAGPISIFSGALSLLLAILHVAIVWWKRFQNPQLHEN